MRYIIFLMLFPFLLSSCLGRGGARNTVTTSVTPETPRYGYTVKRVFPHSESSYTQGLIWHNGRLLEGTGQYGLSALMEVDITTGKAFRTSNLNAKYFGEGITVYDGKIYQLTWMENMLFVYDATSFKPLQEIKYEGEGWGITNDSTHLYMSNGSHKITVRNPETFAIERTIEVRRDGNPVSGLNEMEWIEGEIWANVYMSDAIVRINPENGVVTGVINLEGLLPESDRTPMTDVLNGIAYDNSEKRIYVTGKNWNKLFEIEIVKR